MRSGRPSLALVFILIPLPLIIVVAESPLPPAGSEIDTPRYLCCTYVHVLICTLLFFSLFVLFYSFRESPQCDAFEQMSNARVFLHVQLNSSARLNHKNAGNDKELGGKRDKANSVRPQFALGQDPLHGIDQQHTHQLIPLFPCFQIN